MSHALTTVQDNDADRVRRSTALDVNRQIDRQTEANIMHYLNATPEVIRERVEELDHEWDIERMLEVNASTLALTGLVLGATVNKKWLILPGIVLCAAGLDQGPARQRGALSDGGASRSNRHHRKPFIFN